METKEFAIIAETNKKFDDAVVSVLKAVEQKNWTVFNIYDIKERLAAKGFSHKPLKIVEICSGKYANKMLNKNRMASLCMPCRINILEEGDKVIITGMNPALVSEFFSEISKEDVSEVEKEIKEIIENAK